MARIYATKEQLEDYLDGDPVPDGAGLLLRSASRDVDEMLLTARYPVDAAGLPTVPEHVEAIREATMLQALHRSEHGDEIDMAGASEAVTLGLVPGVVDALGRAEGVDVGLAVDVGLPVGAGVGLAAASSCFSRPASFCCCAPASV